MSDMKRYDPMAPAFHRLGRHEQREEACGLWWSGSGIRWKGACTQVEIEAESSSREHAAWLGVLIDGAPVARFPLLRGRRRYPVLAGMDPEVTHEITLLRDSQPTYDEDGPVLLHALYTDGTVEAPEEKKLLIEFLGDSLTVGEGTLGPRDGQEWKMMWISHLPAFPTLVCSLLDAEERLVALGGWGAYKSWDGRHESRIGAIYEKLCAVTPGGDIPYHFAERGADAVVINLGTNDAGALRKMPQEDWKQEKENLVHDAEALLEMVRRHQKKARIFWAYGLCGTELTGEIRQAVAQYREKTGDQNVSFLPLPDAAGDVGSRSHPSRAAHEKAAAVIAEAVKNL